MCSVPKLSTAITHMVIHVINNHIGHGSTGAGYQAMSHMELTLLVGRATAGTMKSVDTQHG